MASQTATSNGQFWGVLTGTDRPYRATGISELETVPSTAPSTVTHWTGNPSFLFIDSAIRGGTALNATAGETVTNLIGVVDYHESALGYTGILLDPSGGYGSVSGAATGTAAKVPATGQVTIATQNLDQFYDAMTISSAAYTRRVEKTALAIANTKIRRTLSQRRAPEVWPRCPLLPARSAAMAAVPIRLIG